MLHISELADHKIEKPQEVVKQGEEVEVKILRVDTDARKIGLSLRRVKWAAEQREEEDALIDSSDGAQESEARAGGESKGIDISAAVLKQTGAARAESKTEETSPEDKTIEAQPESKAEEAPPESKAGEDQPESKAGEAEIKGEKTEGDQTEKES